VRIEPGAPVRALAGTLASLGIRDVSMPPPGDGPEAAFEIERALIEECAVIPLLHLPDVYAVSRKVRVWDTPGVLRAGGLRLEDVWLIADAP
jgi:hypothetical protein